MSQGTIDERTGSGAPNLMKAYGRVAFSICEPYRLVNSLCSSSKYWYASFLG